MIFVTASASDPSVPLLHSLAASAPDRKVKFVTAGVSEERGEKVNNLIQAIGQAAGESVVYVFTDSDSRVPSHWLRQLVSPLRDEGVGACTGYRWFFPVRGNFASVLRSAWNGSIATLLRDHDHNFAWGGSMAIRRTTFERAQVLRYWKHSISDDYSLTRALKHAGLKIHYEPRCLIASHGDCSWRELLEWSTRQILITKIYSRRLWQLAFVSQFLFLVGWWWGLGALILGLCTSGRHCRSAEPNQPLVATRYHDWDHLSLWSPARVLAVEGCQPHLSRRENYHQSVLVGLHTVVSPRVHFDRLQSTRFSANLNAGMEGSAVRAQVCRRSASGSKWMRSRSPVSLKRTNRRTIGFSGMLS